MTSFYVGPRKPWLNASSWQHLIAAVEVGATTEAQWCELKLGIPASSQKSNIELAKDLASLTVDGGVLLVGIKDDATTAADVVGVEDTTLNSLRTRIDQIAGARVFPPMHVVAHPVPGPVGSNRSVLVVEVPPSASSPHMVDEKCWGRSATGKRPLSDTDVARLMAQRTRRDERFALELDAMDQAVDLLPVNQRTRGRLHVMAEPLTDPSVDLVDATRGQRVIELVVPVLARCEPRWATGFRYLTHEISHPDGLAATTWSPDEWDTTHEEDLTFLLLRKNGAVQLASGDAVRTSDSDGPCISLPAVCETIHLVVATAAHLSPDVLHYRGQWRVGVKATGLRGLYPSQKYGHRARFDGYRFSPFPIDTYVRTSVVSAEQLADPSSTVVETVATDLARGLGLDGVTFPYTSIEDMARKLSST